MPYLIACGCAMCQPATSVGDNAPALAAEPAAVAGINSGSGYIDALLAGPVSRWNYGSAMGTSVSLTYSFATATPDYYPATSWERNNFRALDATKRQAVRDALADYAEVTNITFTEVSDAGAGGQLRFGMASLPSNVGAWAYYPNTSYVGSGYGGDVWLNNIPEFNNMSRGQYGFQATLHEIGHALGLKHPGNYNASGTGTDGPYLPASTDTHRYTVMSYNSDLTQNYKPLSLQLYDIAAIQYLYGANTSTRIGDTTYSWSANQEFVKTIWDGGGTDTIDASNQTRRSIINLNPGTFSSVGRQGINTDANDNLTIAYNCVIENAVSGSGNDVLWGNLVDNVLDSGSGNDFLYGDAGDDTLLPGLGTDSLDGGAGIDTVRLSGAQGSYTVTQSGMMTTVTGLEGTKRLVNVEQLYFAGDSSTVALAASQATPRNDIDGDGRADILWRNATTGGLQLWSMEGAAVSASTTIRTNLKDDVTLGSNWVSKGLGDFDGDGMTDALWWDNGTGKLVVWKMSGGMVVKSSQILNNGAGVTLGSVWRAEGVADFTGDGKADILWHNTSTGGVVLWQMDGNVMTAGANTGAVLNNGAAATLGSEWKAEGVADFTGDGKADVLWRNANTGAVALWQMDGRSMVAGANTGMVQNNGANAALASFWKAEGVADLTGDGKADILWRNGNNGSVLLWQMDGRTVVSGSNTGMVTLSSLGPAYVGTPSTMRTEGVADTTGDGLPEVLWRNPSTGKLTMWSIGGTTVSSDSTVQYNGADATPSGTWNVEALSDFTGDGKADILWRDASTGVLNMWALNGADVVIGSNTGALQNNGSNASLPAAWQVEGAADFTGDGKSDILWRNSSTGAVALWSMDGRTVSTGANTGIVQVNGGNAALVSVWRNEGVADFTGDGKADVLWHNTSTGSVVLWAMDGRTAVAGANTGAVQNNGAAVTLGGDWKSEGVADFTGDGKMDVLWRNSSTGAVALWQMDGRSMVAGSNTGTVQLNGQNATMALSTGWVVAQTADFNNDGKADILWRNNSTGRVALWNMDGRTVLSSSLLQQTNAPAAVASTAQALGTEDYDGDGKADVLWRDTASGQVSLWTLNGIGATVSTVQSGGAIVVAAASWNNIG